MARHSHYGKKSGFCYGICLDFEEKEGKTESEALRKILDVYFKGIEERGLPFEPYRKFSPVGLKVLPRTIRKEQDKKLRKLAEKTGRKISELAREAVDGIFLKNGLTPSRL